MNEDEQLAAVMQKSRKIFLNNLTDKVEVAAGALLDYQVSSDPEAKLILKRFFHSLKGTGATLGFTELAEIGQRYETYLETTTDKPPEIAAKITAGLAKIRAKKQELRE